MPEKWRRDNIIEAVQRDARRLGRTPRERDWRSPNRPDDSPSIATFYAHFRTWDELLEAAELEPYRGRTTARLTPERIEEATQLYDAGQSVRQIARDHYRDWDYGSIETAAVALYRKLPATVREWRGRAREAQNPNLDERLSIPVPEELRQAMVALAAEHDRSVSGEVRVALRRYVEAWARLPATIDSPRKA